MKYHICIYLFNSCYFPGTHCSYELYESCHSPFNQARTGGWIEKSGWLTTKSTCVSVLIRIYGIYPHFCINKHYLNIKARNYIAEDAYALRPASKLIKRFDGYLVYDSREIYSALASLHNHPFKQRILTEFEKYYFKKVIPTIANF